MLQRLTQDVWQFSAAKNYQQMQDMTLALLDDDGKLRSFADFKEEATKTHTKYNSTWLKTEYDHAVGSATMASRWSEFEENAADQPYLKYQTVGDNNVRHEHQLLNGIVRKITDSFWNKYFPPNGWKCRCDVVQLSASYASETEALPKVPIDSMFATNLAKTGMIFPKNHPYYDGVTDDVMKRAVASLPDDVAYNNVYTSESGNTVDLHIYHGLNETPGNIKTAKFLADNGYDVKLLPVLDKDDNDIRELVYKTTSFVKGKNPDALIDNKYLVDLKNCKNSSVSAIHNGIRKAKDQCNYGVINLPEVMDSDNVEDAVRGQMKHAKTIKETWVINGDELLKYDRKGLGLD